MLILIRLDARDRRELETLLEDERALVRRERLAEESGGGSQHFLMRIWTKTEAFLRPIKLLGGIILLVVAFIVWVRFATTPDLLCETSSSNRFD